MRLFNTEQALNDFLKFMSSLGKDEFIALDTETYSIRKGHPQGGLLPAVSRIRLIQLATEKDVFVLDLLCLSDILYKTFIQSFVSRLDGLKLVAHNASFDMAHLLFHCPQFRFSMSCTQTIFYILISALDGEPHAYKADLGNLMNYFFDEKMSKDLQMSDWSNPELSEAQLAYAAGDVIGTRKLFYVLRDKIVELGLEGILELEDSLRPALVNMSCKGFHIDTELHDSLSTEWKEKTEIAEKECINFLNTDFPFHDDEALKALLFNKVKDVETISRWFDVLDLVVPANGYDCLLIKDELFTAAEDIITEADIKKYREIKKNNPENPDLPTVKKWTKDRTALRRIAKNIEEALLTPSKKARLGHWIEERISKEELAEWPRTEKSNELSINKEAFDQFSYLPFLKPIADYSDMAKLHSTYGEGMKQFIINGNLACNFKQGYAVTGRLSSRAPNIQNQPNRGPGKQLRKIFIPSSANNILLRADFNQIELRVAAIVSGDKRMLAAYEQGMDLHTTTAMGMTGKSAENISPEERTSAKVVNFALLYGAGAKSLIKYAWTHYKVLLTLAQAEEYVRIFRETYPEYREWQMNTAQEAERTLTATTPLGRFRILPSDRYYTTSMNQPIQGGAGEVMKLAIIYMDQEISLMPEESGNAYLVTTVHDEIIVDSPIDFSERNAKVIENCMKQAMLSVFPTACLNNLVEVTAGRNWLEAK